MSQTVILVSPAPVDGYPPVQYQARILADAGFEVELVTQPLPDRQAVKFRHPGVRITTISPLPRNLARPIHLCGLLWQTLQFVAAISLVRLRRQSVAAEIAFDPNGVMMSDYALFRPRRRIAHLHETVQRIGESHLETRLPRALLNYGLVVVADEGRADLLQEQLNLPSRPSVTPNYPLMVEAAPPTGQSAGFEVIYGGSLSPNHMIDLVIRSTRLWPSDAHLTLLGDDTRPAALKLKELARSIGVEDRVRFLGWMDLDQIIDRYRQAHLGISLLSPHQPQLVLSVGASNKRYQYMQAGLAQIGDRMPGLPELLEGHGTGRCVADYSEQAIADLVDHYWRNPEERIAAGRRAELLYRERYNYQTAFEPTLRWIQGRQST